MEPLEQLIKILSDSGQKETAELARHSDTIEEFISYMEFDIDERTLAIKIAESLIK